MFGHKRKATVAIRMHLELKQLGRHLIGHVFQQHLAFLRSRFQALLLGAVHIGASHAQGPATGITFCHLPTRHQPDPMPVFVAQTVLQQQARRLTFEHRWQHLAQRDGIIRM